MTEENIRVSCMDILFTIFITFVFGLFIGGFSGLFVSGQGYYIRGQKSCRVCEVINEVTK